MLDECRELTVGRWFVARLRRSRPEMAMLLDEACFRRYMKSRAVLHRFAYRTVSGASIPELTDAALDPTVLRACVDFDRVYGDRFEEWGAARLEALFRRMACGLLEPVPCRDEAMRLRGDAPFTKTPDMEAYLGFVSALSDNALSLVTGGPAAHDQLLNILLLQVGFERGHMGAQLEALADQTMDAYGPQDPRACLATLAALTCSRDAELAEGILRDTWGADLAC